MKFLFIDKILQIDAAKHAVGIKHVTADDHYLQITSDGRTVLMSSILGETLGQLAAWVVMHANEFSLRPVAGVVGEVEILGSAQIGDTILLEATIDSVDESAVLYHAIASVNQKPILILHNALGPFLPMQDFIDPVVARQQFDALHHASDNTKAIANERTTFYVAGFDHVLEIVPGEKIIAQKNVTMLEPFWSDHFPCKPVLPLSILLEAKLNLAQQLLQQSLGAEAQYFQPHKLSKIKMSDFVTPGQSVITHATIKEQTVQAIKINFKSFVNDKRVCVAEAEFVRS